MPREYAKFGEWNKVGFKNSTVKVDEDKRTSQRAKFAKCRFCGGQMTYLQGTNILICENEVEKSRKRTDDTGAVIEYTVTEKCGNVNMVADEFQGYMNYLFSETK